MSFLISEILSFSCKIILNSSNFKILIIFSEFDSSPKLLTFFYLYFFFFTFSGPETLCCIILINCFALFYLFFISVETITCIFVACLFISLLGLLCRGRRGKTERGAPQTAPRSSPPLSPPLSHLRLSLQHPSHPS